MMVLLYLGKKIIKIFVVVLFVAISSCHAVYTSQPKVENAIYRTFHIDSIRYCIPEKEGYYIFDNHTRPQFLNSISSEKIPFRTLNKNDNRKELRKVERAISNADVAEILPYNTDEIKRYTSVDKNLSVELPGIHWVDADDGSVRGIAIVYTGSKQSLIWFGLDFVDIENTRLKCDIYSILN